MKAKYLIPIFLLMSACGNSIVEDESSKASFELAEASYSTNSNKLRVTTEDLKEEPIESRNQKLIKNGFLEFEAADLSKTIALIKAEAEKVGGYVVRESESEMDNRNLNNIRLRVPAEQFTQLLATISKGVERFDRKEVTANDVTEEFMDLQTRIETKKKVEQRYLEILKQANTVKDILLVETQAGQVRGEIERMEGRLKYLSDQTSFSIIDITCYQAVKPFITSDNTFIGKLKAGLNNGIGIIKTLIIGIVSIWPLIILGLVGVLLYKYRSGRKRMEAV